MSNKFIATAVTAGVAGALVAGVCMSAGSASAVGGRATLTYSVSKSGAITGKAHTAPGYAEIVVAGAKGQAFQLVRPRNSSVTKSDALKDFIALGAQNNPKPFESQFKATGGINTHHTLFVSLDPGTYYALDTNARGVTKKDIKTIHVAGSRVNSARPELGGTVRSVGDMMWSSKPGHIAASGYLQFENRSESNANNTHFVVLVKLKKGKTEADLKKLFTGKESQKKVFAGGPHTSYNTGVLSHGKTQVSSYSLKPGKYMLACFFTDRMTGQPHAVMGMYRAINVG